jgi:hypothetical protein
MPAGHQLEIFAQGHEQKLQTGSGGTVAVSYFFPANASAIFNP